MSDDHFGVEHALYIDDFISDIAFFQGICISCENCNLLPCPDNFTMLIDVVSNTKMYIISLFLMIFICLPSSAASATN